MKQTVRNMLGRWRWSHSVAHYYPVHPRPRWGQGLPRHAQLTAALERWRSNYENALNDIASHKAKLAQVPYERSQGLPQTAFWYNCWFTGIDAVSLLTFLWTHRPTRYLEIGSGHSTMFARYAVTLGNLPTTITSIDPHPRAEIDLLCDQVIRRPLEECDVSVFDALGAGDILFFDGSHRAFTNDVTVFFFEVLPRLQPGVLVHVHDIFLPEDYPAVFNDRLYSEQYLLGAMLLCPTQPFEVKLPNYFATADPVLGGKIRDILRVENGRRDIPVCNGSFWLEMKGGCAQSAIC
ncbi:MAG: class I SAM-dependent methyltransferase [Methylocella sp.]